MKTLNATQAIELLREIVAEKGEDFVYERRELPVSVPACMYATIGEGDEVVPDCIVGHVFARIGILSKEFVYTDRGPGTYASGIAGSVLGSLRTDGVLSATSGARSVLGAAQTRQDSGYTWGESLQEAERAYKRI